MPFRLATYKREIERDKAVLISFESDAAPARPADPSAPPSQSFRGVRKLMRDSEVELSDANHNNRPVGTNYCLLGCANLISKL